MGASQPEGSLLWGALCRLTLSEPPWEDSACRFAGSHARSEPPGLQVTQPLSPDPGFYQEIRERGLNTSHESDDDLLGEPSSPDGTGKAGAPIVVKSYRPAQVTWSQLPEVGPGRRAEVLSTLEGTCSRELPSCCAPGCPAPRALWVWVPWGRSMRATCHWRHSSDKPPAREPLALSLRGLICRSCGQRDPLPRGLPPQRAPEGPSGPRQQGKGEGQASASREPHAVVTLPPHPHT